MPVGHTAETFLNQMVFDGLKQRFTEITPEIEPRARTELKVIEDMNFASYFLIVADFISFARDKGIPVGPGEDLPQAV